MIGVPVLYILLAGQNLHKVCEGTSGELTFPIWVIICSAIVTIPFIFFKSMKEVGFLSAFGMLATVIVVFIVLAMAVRNQPNHADVHHDAVIWDQFPIALSSIVFSFGKFSQKFYALRFCVISKIMTHTKLLMCQ